MSRCFQFPPPGHRLSRAGADVALIESIKLQRDREQAEAERKKGKKKEKKEKRKEKKEKAYLKSSPFSHDQKIDKVEKGWTGLKDGFLQCVREEENEQLEKSSLTEEHGQPICLQNPSSSLDSTQNSNKRKRHTSPPTIVKQEGRVSRDGNVIRIRLPSQKQQVVDAVVVREAPCSSSGRTDLPVQQKHKIAPVVQDKISPSPEGTNGVLPCRTDAEQICSRSEKTEAVIKENASTPGCEKHEKKLQRRESKYKHLMENWNRPPLQMELDFDDGDWLLARKKPEKQVEEKLKAGQDVSSCSRSALWPRAQLLPEADIHALPFTVPF